MAVAMMLSRSTKRLATVGRQYFCRSRFSTAVNLNRLIIPSNSISSVRQLSSSIPVTRLSPSEDNSVANQKSTLDESAVKDLLSQLQSLKDELQAMKIAKAKEELDVKEKEEVKVEEVLPKENDALIGEIDSQISTIHVKGKEEILPDSFPFKIRKDKPGAAEVTLSRRYKDETITIKVKNPWTSERGVSLAHDYDIYLDSDRFEMPLIVGISTSWLLFSSKSIEFHCTAERHRIVIEKIRDPADETDGGVLFRTLDDVLCEEIAEYLERRDITPDTAEQLYEYMLNRMNKENKRGLQKFKELIEAAA